MSSFRFISAWYGAAVALVATCGAFPAAAQTSDSVEVVASPRYAAEGWRENVLGREYRDLWTMPVRVPLLDLDGFAGGLTPVERGGGQQTRALRMLGEDGQEYNFRSVDKWVSPDPRSDLADTPAEAFVQDQVSSLHPAAAIVATGLLDAAGILNPGPRLVVMPDDARLGEFRDEFAGMLGTIEVHANEPDDGGPGFAGADAVESEEDFFQALRESPANQVDARALLAERLLSLLMADWDRHEGQYRWARFDSGGTQRWVPVAEDRDYAFADYDGLIFRFGSGFIPKAAPFEPVYASDLLGLTMNSAQLDRRLLAGLSWGDWQPIVDRLEADLSDAAIEAAVRRMPPEYFAASGAGLIDILTARRDGLSEVARRFYLQLAAEAEVHGTDAAERADVERLGDGSVRVTLVAADGDADADGSSGAEPQAATEATAASEASQGARPYYDRTFRGDETREIRIHLHGGDDVAVVSGEAAGGPLVRVLGGAGADSLHDRSRVGGRELRTALYDADEDGAIEPGGEAVVERSPLHEPVWIPGEVLPPRDWGSTRSWFTPWVDYEGTEGVIIGGGPSWTWYGFRRYPYAARAAVRVLYGTGSGRAAVDGVLEARGVGSTPDVLVHGRISGMEAFRFHGFGNATDEEVVNPIVRYAQRLLELRLGYRPLPGLTLSLGPRVELLDAQGEAGESTALRSHGKAGLAGDLELDTSPERDALSGGFRLAASGVLYPPAWDLSSPVGRLSGEAAGYLPLPLHALVAVRAGGASLWGDALLPEAALLGGSATLRGYPYQRFAGDAMVYGGIEGRARLARLQLVSRGNLGILAFTDAGRVFVDGESSGGWHTSVGAGLWFETLGAAVSATYARGDDDVVYLKLGLPY